jgi:hypothetical protein
MRSDVKAENLHRLMSHVHDLNTRLCGGSGGIISIAVEKDFCCVSSVDKFRFNGQMVDYKSRWRDQPMGVRQMMKEWTRTYFLAA